MFLYTMFTFFLLGFTEGTGQGPTVIGFLEVAIPPPISQILCFLSGHSLLGLFQIPVKLGDNGFVNAIPVFLSYAFTGTVNGSIAGFVWQKIRRLRNRNRLVSQSLSFMLFATICLSGFAHVHGDDGNFSEFRADIDNLLANIPVLIAGSLGAGMGIPWGFWIGQWLGGGDIPPPEFDSLRHCGNCGAEIGDLLTCPYCGYEEGEPDGELDSQFCQRCGAEIPPGSAFCTECGQRYGTLCSNCGANIPPGNVYCTQCGQPSSLFDDQFWDLGGPDDNPFSSFDEGGMCT